MTLHTKSGGVWLNVADLYTKRSGLWTPVQTAYVKDAGIWKVYYQSEIVVHISANAIGVVLATLFTTADWASDKAKRVIVDPGVTVAGASWGAIAPQNGGQSVATWGGSLILDNYGSIQGVGGAPNSGAGGNAMYSSDPAYNKRCLLNNYGSIIAGGGGGGRGGGGYYENTVREPASGEYYAPAVPQTGFFDNVATNFNQIIWFGTTYRSGGGIPADGTFIPNLGNVYRGTLFYNGGSGGERYYAIYRTYQQGVNSDGGPGGRGQGSDGAWTQGSGGGPNAGFGGWGGNWGEPGYAGVAGNRTGPDGGGAAGIAYYTGMYDVIVNTGTILGRVT